MFATNKFILRNSIKIFSLFLTLLIISCNDDANTRPIIPAEITYFSFSTAFNPSLKEDLNLTFGGVNTFTGSFDYECDVENLVASFEFVGDNVTVNGVVQEKFISSNNFTTTLEYVVSGLTNNNSKSYFIEISYLIELPRILIDTNNTLIDSKDDYVEGFVTVKGGLKFGDLATQKMKIRGRGNSTWSHPKKPYQLKFGEKTPMLNMAEDKKWLFLAEYSDKSLIRNKISLDLGAMSRLAYTPKGEYAEVFLNGKYNGTYLITQKVEVKSNRLNLPNNGYLIEIDQLGRLDADDVYFEPTAYKLNHGSVFNIKEPSVAIDSPEYLLIKNI